MIYKWKLNNINTLYKGKFYALEELLMTKDVTNEEFSFTRFNFPDWVNIIPFNNRNIICIKQYRSGIEDFTIEIPGGIIEPDKDISPARAAEREMAEEIGMKSYTMKELKWFHPNPAIQLNKVYFFYALDTIPVPIENRDIHEDIEIVEVPASQILTYISEGKITHSLVVLAILYLNVLHPELF